MKEIKVQRLGPESAKIEQLKATRSWNQFPKRWFERLLGAVQLLLQSRRPPLFQPAQAQ
jgi:hypothetical protein